uniref:Reverse transcriptase domain-containing protein n=1 Tax=Tanacetum cinerariifolium TaxID=118510 RepID=A0A699I193_TANCI|nr:reverse transcriptase domain-containing protein [Tanacetum cinerariifolium]
MKLNPKKCTFEIREGMFLGYKVNADGLKVCPDKVEAVLSLLSLKCLKGVQRLNGKLASLNRFLSKLAKKSLSFFKTLKKCTKKSDFQWTAKAEMAFKQMKTLIAKLPMLTTPKEKEELVIYLAAAKEAVSGPNDRKGWKINAYILRHGIHYRPRTSVKGQILGDFIIERPDDDPPDTPMEDKEELLDPWILFTNGSSCTDGSGSGLIITSPPLQENYILREIHEGSCSMHAGPRSVVEKALRSGPFRRESEQAAIQEAKSKAMMEKYYNARVCSISFKPGDLVYRSNEASHAKDGGKLRPKWEGPYEVTKTLEKGAYKIRDRNRNILPRTWNVYNLKKCYVHEM